MRAGAGDAGRARLADDGRNEVGAVQEGRERSRRLNGPVPFRSCVDPAVVVERRPDVLLDDDRRLLDHQGLAGAAAIVALRCAGAEGFGAGLDRTPRRWDAQGGCMRVRDTGIIGGAALFLMLPLSAVLLAGLEGIPVLPMSVYYAAFRSILASSTALALMD